MVPSPLTASGSMYLEWKYLGIRMELGNFYNGNMVEGSGPYKPPYTCIHAYGDPVLSHFLIHQCSPRTILGPSAKFDSHRYFWL